ncbi:MAG: tetratricopeptide repeat-containing serine protease family protein [Verrucomicrobiota bacterium]
MKANQLVSLLLFLMLGVAVAQQTNSASSVTNSGAIAELKAKAEKGDAIAEYKLGYRYCVGQGLPKDFAEAAKWLRKAAEQGIAVAQYDLALVYDKGDGMTNRLEAAKWFRKAAEQGNAEAQADLGIDYLIGKGVDKDSREGVKWLRKAAEQGVIRAEGNLGSCYANGDGIETNYVEAVKWLRKAAEQGEAYAQLSLAQSYTDGAGVVKDYAEAVKWFRKAAEQGLVDAQVNLGVCYHNGDGVPQNYVEAYKWFNLASAQGNTEAKQFLSDLEQQMTAEQIAEGQQLSAAFVLPKGDSGLGSDNFVSPDVPTASGTGFFITDDGYLISNYHVVKNATKVRLLTSAGLIDAKVVQVDAANDLALLKAEGKFSPLPISPSRSARLGSTVATIGFPDIGLQGFAPKLAKGEIASLSGAVDDARYFQISVPVQPGNSGGALVDERGNVVGIVSAKLDAAAALASSGALPENVNYAVKSSFLLSFLESVPDVANKLKAPNTKEEKFEDVVKSAQDASALVLVY